MVNRLVVSLTSEAQDYQALQAADAREAGARLGVEVDTLFAEDNPVLQIQQLFRFVHAPEGQRPAAILLHTRVADGLERVARKAAQAGIGWILLNRTASYLDPLRRDHPKLAIAAVTTDHAEIGRIHARQFQKRLPAGGRVLYIQGPTDAPAAQSRLSGFEAESQGRPVELRVLNGAWTAASGEKAVASWLRLRTSDLFEPDAVVCQNDLMARGAREALQKLRPEWARAPFFGCDGLPQGGRREVDEGRLAATVVIPSCAGPAVELVVKWIGSGAVPPAETVLAPASYPPT